jgi:calcium-dependent protein kinase
METLKVTGGDFVTEKKGKLRDSYRIGNKLGDGAFGSVRKITHRVTGEVRAVKTIHKKNLRSEEERQTFFNEVSVLRALDHPNILKLYEFYQDEKNFYLITELCNGGELFDRIISHGSFSEAVAANYMQQILSVITYCHDRNIVHRDLKPENFLLDTTSEEANLKVIDFGTSQFFVHGTPLTAKFGTPYYIAPEVLRCHYDEKCDVWSAGVNMYVLLCGYPPFGGSNDDQILKKIAIGRFSFPSPEWDFISFEAKDLITKMLTFEPHRRISAREALNHQWLHNASRAPIDTSTARTIFTNLQTFRSEQKLQKATYAFIVSQLATKKEKEEMLELFKSLDTDGSGTLSRQELIEGFHNLYVEEIDDIEAEVDKIMHQVDTDGSGEIDYSEFVAASMNRSKLLSKERLEAAFKTFDIDGSGTISADELKAILGKHHAYEDEIWQEIIKEVDQNGDGVIDLREFSEMMLKFSQLD